MSLERQVRIAAGFLVVIGVSLGALINPGFYVLPGFVGRPDVRWLYRYLHDGYVDRSHAME